MNFELTSFLAGLIIGWIGEWIIDYLYWRRGGRDPEELAEIKAQLAGAEARAQELGLSLATAESDRDEWHSKFKALQAEAASLRAAQERLAECQDNYDNLETAYTKLQSDHQAALLAAGVAAAEGAHRAGTGRTTTIKLEEPDDLTLIQGIGPRYEEKLALYGITTYAGLAVATDEQLDGAIEPQSWQKVDYDSWRAQARTFAEMPPQRPGGDDLQRLEGIGPKYEQLLRGAGIVTYADLAAADSAQLATIIGASPWRRVDYGAWLAQARLAAAGREEELAALQDQLYRREGDNLLLIHGLGDASYLALTDAGVTSYAALAQMQPEEVNAILTAAGLRRANTAAWIEEAALRAAGKRVARVKRDYKEARVVSCPQDLERIFGIGVVYEQRLYAAGVGSYWEVAQLTDELLQELLEVEAFQDVDPAEIRRSAMELAVATKTVNRVWDGSPPDDFEPLEGIGIVYERRLYDAGICTYEALAASKVADLERVCRPPAFQKPDFAGWISAAAALAAARKDS